MRQSLVITLLIGLNIVLGTLLIRRHVSSGQGDNGPGLTQKAPTFAATNVRTSPPPPENSSTQTETNSFQWAQLEAEDYTTYIQRLRSIGCPEQTIRDIVIADLEKLMAEQMQEIEGNSEPPKYWEPSRKHLTSTKEELERLKRKQELDFEKRKVIQDLLGIDLAAERLNQRGESDFYGERMGFLSADKQAQVRMILERSNQEEMNLREKSWLANDALTPEDKQRLREIETRKEAEVAALLTPSELDNYQLWFSPSAYKVRESFAGFEPTEKEFLAAYNLQRDFDSTWGKIEPAQLSGIESEKYYQAQAELEAALREELGPDRFQEFEQGQDRAYRELERAAIEFGLSPGVAREVYGFKTILEEQRRNVALNATLNPMQKEEIRRALGEETERAVVEALGPAAYKYYIRSGAGNWIRE